MVHVCVCVRVLARMCECVGLVSLRVLARVCVYVGECE